MRASFREIWPDLRHIWLRNPEYAIPTKAELEEELSIHKISLPIIGGYSECDLFALILQARVKEWRVRQNPEDGYPWALGDFVAEKQSLLGTIIHSACICLTDEGFLIIEPMEENKIVIPKSGKYEIFFVNLV